MYNAIPTSGGFFFAFCSVIYMYRYLTPRIVLKYYCISFNMYTSYKIERNEISYKTFSVES